MRRLTPEDLARVDRYLRNWEAEERVEFWLFLRGHRCGAIPVFGCVGSAMRPDNENPLVAIAIGVMALVILLALFVGIALLHSGGPK